MPASNAFEAAFSRARPEPMRARSDHRPRLSVAGEPLPDRPTLADALFTLAGYTTACPEARARTLDRLAA